MERTIIIFGHSGNRNDIQEGVNIRVCLSCISLLFPQLPEIIVLRGGFVWLLVMAIPPTIAVNKLFALS